MRADDARPIQDRAIHADELTRMARQLSDARQVLPAGPFIQAGGGFGAPLGSHTDPIWIQITGDPDGSNYPWQEVVEDDGTWLPPINGRSGTSDLYFAVPVDDSPDVPVDTIGRAWLGDDGLHWDFVYQAPAAGGGDSSDESITYNNDTFTARNTRNTFIATTWRPYSLTINPPANYYGGVTFAAWLEICGNLGLCCELYAFVSSIAQDWLPPGPATVYPVLPLTSGTIVESIIPAAFSNVPQTTYPAHTGSGTTQAATTPVATAPGDTIVATAWGTYTTSMSLPTVVDNLGNAFSQDAFVVDPVSKLWCGVWSFLSTGAAAITFSYTGGPGKINLIAEEVSSIVALSPVAQSLTNNGSSNAPTPGPINFGVNPYRYIAMTFAAAELKNPATITPPDGAATYYQETNGIKYTVGSSDGHANDSLTAYTPTWGLDAAAPWVACAVVYKLQPGPQLITLVNRGSSTTPLIIPNNGSFTPGEGFPILLPPEYNDVPAGQWVVSLGPMNSITLWFDACDGDAWIVWDCTVSPVGVQAGTETPLKRFPHLHFTSNDNSVGIATTADGGNNRVGIDFSAGALTVEDTHGHTVTGVHTIVLKDGTNTTGTVSSGGTGVADMEVDATGGGGSLGSGQFALPNNTDGNTSDSIAPKGSPVPVTYNMGSDTVQLVLPAAGNYLLWASLTGFLTYSGSPSGNGQLFEANLLDLVTDEWVLNTIGDTPTWIELMESPMVSNSTTFQTLYSTTGSTTIQLQAQLESGTAIAGSIVMPAILGYLKIG